MSTAANKRIPLIIVTVILVVIGALHGLVFARFSGKNLLSEHLEMEVTLAEEVVVADVNSIINSKINNDDSDSTVTLPAGTTGKLYMDYWYYHPGVISEAFPENHVSFNLENEQSVLVHITDDPEKIQYSDCIDSGKIESPQTVIDASNQAVRNYQIKWRNWQIKGAVIGLIISVIAAAAIWLILHFSSKEKTSSVLFIITTAIDIVLILDSVMLYRLFSHLL